jgi:hypothetical protein
MEVARFDLGIAHQPQTAVRCDHANLSANQRLAASWPVASRGDRIAGNPVRGGAQPDPIATSM